MTAAPKPRTARKRKPRALAPRTRAWARPALVAALVTAIVAVGVFGHYLLSPHRGAGRTVQVTFAADAGASEITRALWQGGIIDKPYLFHALMLVTRARSSVHTRSLRFRDDLAPRVVLRAMLNGTAGLVRVTIPEGFNRFDIARRVSAAGVCPYDDFVRDTADPQIAAQMGFSGAQSLEGYLYPDTYDLGLESPCAKVIERMTRVFQRRFEALLARHPEALEHARALAGPSDPRAAIVTLAALVEKETGAPADRAHVASVFWNRLTFPEFHPRLLQSDPSVTYGCLVSTAPSCALPDGGVRVGITTAMLADAQNPYNTYRVEALPPGPICNPGARALEAVMAPSDDRDLYFVAMPDGRSAFAPTLSQHTENVRRYLHPMAPIADGGPRP